VKVSLTCKLHSCLLFVRFAIADVVNFLITKFCVVILIVSGGVQWTFLHYVNCIRYWLDGLLFAVLGYLCNARHSSAVCIPYDTAFHVVFRADTARSDAHKSEYCLSATSQ